MGKNYTRVIDLGHNEAKSFFLKNESYFNLELPAYINFTDLLECIDHVMNGKLYCGFKAHDPEIYSNVNYLTISNKDGSIAWRPFEIIHPVIYVSLVNIISTPCNWKCIQDIFHKYENSWVTCCSHPVRSDDKQSDKAEQIFSWWTQAEQHSIEYALDYSHILHTDVVNCYGSIYTHSVSWALHGRSRAKQKGKSDLLGDRIDQHLRAGRYGQTNGIPQGSALMDFIAEIVLGYVDRIITCRAKKRWRKSKDFKILRYRDDYRIFTNEDTLADEILKIISDSLRLVGMKLGAPKTIYGTNVVESSLKKDKLAAISIWNAGDTNATTLQKQLLRLHSFGQTYPNSGTLLRLVSDLEVQVRELDSNHNENGSNIPNPNEIGVLVSIATDIAFVSPRTMPPVAAILSILFNWLDKKDEKENLWKRVTNKMHRVPNNGHLEIWLQRVSKAARLPFDSKETICRLVDGKIGTNALWNNKWIDSRGLKRCLSSTQVIEQISVEPIIPAEETRTFRKAALYES